MYFIQFDIQQYVTFKYISMLVHSFDNFFIIHAASTSWLRWRSCNLGAAGCDRHPWILESEHCVINRVDFPSDSNTHETPCHDEHLQAEAILAIDESDKSLPRLICMSDRERERSLASNVMPWIPQSHLGDNY